MDPDLGKSKRKRRKEKEEKRIMDHHFAQLAGAVEF